MDNMNINITEFLIELEALSRKRKLRIGGCGCCGSPYIETLSDDDIVVGAGYNYLDELKWVSPDKDGEWGNETLRPAKPANN